MKTKQSEMERNQFLIIRGEKASFSPYARNAFALLFSFFGLQIFCLRMIFFVGFMEPSRKMRLIMTSKLFNFYKLMSIFSIHIFSLRILSYSKHFCVVVVIMFHGDASLRGFLSPLKSFSALSTLCPITLKPKNGVSLNENIRRNW